LFGNDIPQNFSRRGQSQNRAQLHSAASRNRIRTCPQNTQMDADQEFLFRICVNLRGLRAEAFSLVLCLLQERILAPMRKKQD
jgi:hypothetical protein